MVDSSEEAIKLLLTVVGGGSVDNFAAVTGVASPIRNMIFFACSESQRLPSTTLGVALSLQTVQQARELVILSLVLLRSLLFLSEFLAEFQQTVQRLLDGLRENTPFVLVNENFRN